MNIFENDLPNDDDYGKVKKKLKPNPAPAPVSNEPVAVEEIKPKPEVVEQKNNVSIKEKTQKELSLDEMFGVDSDQEQQAMEEEKKEEKKEAPKPTIVSQEKAQNSDENADSLAPIGHFHYDTRKEIDQFDRRALKTINLRNFHNWIKSVLINKYTRDVSFAIRKKTNKNLKLSGLDFGCGKGGDLKKWQRSQIGHLVGIDVSSTAVEDARSRWMNTCQKSFQAIFINISGGAPESEFFAKIPQDIYFDVVSSQFVIHYLFEKEEYIHNALNNLAKKLANGGYFLCTFPDSYVMIKRLKEIGTKAADGSITFGNEFYSIKFDDDHFPKSKLYGIKYGFFLDEAVGTRSPEGHIEYVPEYLIVFDNFVSIAKQYGLEMVYHKNFHDFFKENIKNSYYYNLFTKTVLSDFTYMERKLWEISYLYKVAVFRKDTGEDIGTVPRNF
jgi:mRNA (guanine-N7-)-methyltransferase